MLYNYYVMLPNPSSLSLLSKNTLKALPVSTFNLPKNNIHLTPNYCLCCSVIASYKSSGIWAWQAYLCPKHATVLLNHGHIRNKFVALSLCYWYFISWVLSFAVLARQYFPGFYFCDFNRQIWKEGIKFFWQKPGPLKTSR